MTEQTTATIFDGATITLIRPLNAADTFEGVQDLDRTDIEASAERYWEQYRAAVAEAYPTAAVEVDTPWRQYRKPFGIDVDLHASIEWDQRCEDEEASIQSIGEAVFERGEFWVEADA